MPRAKRLPRVHRYSLEFKLSAVRLSKLPIDHVLARGFDLVSGARGPDFGSGHYPVLARLAPR